MTRKEARDLLPIIQAYAEGKTIQRIDDKNKWIDLCLVNFDYSPNKYRIKPEPKYRPFKTKEECWEEMHKHPDFGWVKGNVTGEYKQIIRIYDNETELIYNMTHSSPTDYSPEIMLSSYTFTDGIPFGVKDE